jgi:hypothetical protein
MFKSREEYLTAKQRIDEDRQVAVKQRAALETSGLPPEQIERALEPLLTFHAQLVDEVEWYERIARGDFSSLQELEAIGRLIIAIRLVKEISEEEFADRLGITVEQLVRDERDEYYGFTTEELGRVFEALGVRIHTTVIEETERQRELAHVN